FAQLMSAVRILRPWPRWAACRGIDAMDWRGGTDFVLVLNRTALRIQDVALVPRRRDDGFYDFGADPLRGTTGRGAVELSLPAAASRLLPGHGRQSPGPLRALCVPIEKMTAHVATMEERLRKNDQLRAQLKAEI